MDNQKSELADKDKSSVKKENMILLEVKLKLNINKVTKNKTKNERINHGNFVTAIILEIL